MKQVDAILTSDWHLREDQPICRTDDFWEAQWNKVDQVSELQKKYDCLVLHAGDLFNHWKPSPYLLSTTKLHLPKQFFTIYGQHDLPQHNFGLRNKSGIYDLEVSGFVTVLGLCHFGQIPEIEGSLMFVDSKVLVWHKFVWDGNKIPWPNCDEMTAKEVLETYPEFDLIVTGDHHKPFIEYDQPVMLSDESINLLVNPGCLTRQAADYANHKPRVYLWNAERNIVRPHYLDIEEDVVSREHIEIQEQRDRRIEAFVSRLTNEWDVGVSFEENLTRFFSDNRMRKSVVELVYKAIENEDRS